ncbi:TetR family transcriptional regulator [Aliirhizobium terrae]|uniref:TetR family transcriptional regulator n=1 Tax=Terrirhizobium terrae TaxID=2926709 RepID=UPI0025764290|nr:TetR family transcriptional regulator [Rhizobium sp. CC-CFT758]WJH42141.1 TetR family transcriptional regulator [Rhizobium sp. CC-CFT758]
MDPVKQENVDRILDAAERLFKHYGYSKTNVADIAKDLGMSPANIYRFFSSKAEIHKALASRMLAASRDVAVINAKRPVSATERLRDHFLQQHQITVETLLHENKVHEMVVVAIQEQWSVVEDHIMKLRTIVAGLVREGIASGEFRDQDADFAAECLCDCIVTLCHPQIIAECLIENRRTVPADLVDFALRALK